MTSYNNWFTGVKAPQSAHMVYINHQSQPVGIYFCLYAPKRLTEIHNDCNTVDRSSNGGGNIITSYCRRNVCVQY
jgi:hypothetical protein